MAYVLMTSRRRPSPASVSFLIGRDAIVLADGLPGRGAPDIDSRSPASHPALHRDP
jgi:hypothetical protein